MRFFRWLIISSIVLLSVYSLVGFVGVPYFIRHFAVKQVYETTGQTLDIDAIEVNPFTFELSLAGIELTDAAGMPHLKVKSIAIEADMAGLLVDDKAVNRLEIADAHFYSDVKGDGSLGLLDIFSASPGDDRGTEKNQTSLILNQLRVNGTRLTLHSADDVTRIKSTTLGPLSLAVDDFATKPDMASTLSDLTVELGGGEVSLSGAITISPFALDVDFNMVDLNLQNLHQLAELVKRKVTGISDVKGIVNATGDIEFTDSISINFDSILSGIEIEEGSESSRVFALNELNIAGVTAQYSPEANVVNQVSVEQIILTKPELTLVRKPDGNLLLPGAEEAAIAGVSEETGSPAVAFDLKVLRVKDGKITFEDRNLVSSSDHTITNLDAINLATGELRYPIQVTDAPTPFKLDGLVGGESVIRAKGQSRLEAPYQTDAELIVDRLSSSVIASYTGEYLGRDIKTGELFLDLKYKIPTTVIEGHNIILFNDWRWGKRVESEEAADVPLDLAFSLLEDKDGRVKLDIPVNGDLTDPEFEIGPLIQKATGNLITGIVSSPFKLLGSLIPGGKDDLDLSAVSFPADEIDIPALEKAKLSALAMSLNERPRLRLTIEGRAYKEPFLDINDDVEGDVSADRVVISPTEIANGRANAIRQFLVEAGINENRLILLPIIIDDRKVKATIKNKLGIVTN